MTKKEKQNKNNEYFSFIHVADSHNGYSGNSSRYNEYSALRVEKTTERGINVRQDDIDKAFQQVIDIAIEKNVDAVLHAGDGTDSWGYKQPYVYNTYTNQVIRLKDFGIDYVEVVGNHNLPKKVGVGCYLESLGKYPGVHTVYKGFYETVELEEHGVVIHCAPSTFTQEILNDSLAEISPIDGKLNIGMGHFGVTTIKHYAENSESTLVATLDQLVKCKMDYFALGDYHETMNFGHNIWYSGSIERMGFGEVNNTPKVLYVKIHKETKEVIVEEIPLEVRPMLDLKSIDAREKDEDRINELIEERIKSKDLADAIVRLRVFNLPKTFKSAIDVEKVRKLSDDALYFKLELKDKTENSIGTRTSYQTQFEGVLESWQTFMDKVEDDGSFDKEKLAKVGFKRLADAFEG